MSKIKIPNNVTLKVSKRNVSVIEYWNLFEV